MTQPETPPETRSRILGAAEKLFSSQGFTSTSLRSIVAEAKVNLAAIHYHFGSKEALIQAVFARRIEPINAERLRRLDQLEAAGEASVEAIVEAFIRPPLRLSREPGGTGAVVVALIGRTYAEPGDWIHQLLVEQFGELARRFAVAMARALPELPRAELLWRLHFLVGAMAHTMTDSRKLELLSGGLCDASDGEAIARRLVPFLAAGMRAPLATGPDRGGDE